MKILLFVLLMVIYYFPFPEIRILMINIVSIAWLISFLIYTIFMYYRFDKEYKAKTDEKYISKIPVYRTPVELGFLLEGRIGPNCVTSTIMNLIKKEILSVKKENEDFILTYHDGDRKDVERSEAFLIRWLFKRMGHMNRISVNNLATESKLNSNYFYILYKEWHNSALVEGLRQSFFEKRETFSQNAYAFMGVAIVLAIFNFMVKSSWLIVIALLGASLLFSIYLFNLNRRTKEANEEYESWLAFRRYLTSHDAFNSIDEINFLEDCAVYAQVFKILPSYRGLLNDKFKDSKAIKDSILLSMIKNNELIEMNKAIESCIKWSCFKESLLGK